MHKTNAFLPSREELFQELLIPVGFYVIIRLRSEERRCEMKRITKVVLILITLLLSASGCSGSSENWAYKGFIIEVYENARGEPVIVTISDDVESEFVIKTNTEMIAPVHTPVSVGDYVQLTTTRSSDRDIKKMQVSVGYSTSGRLVFFEGEESPFVLTETGDGARLLVRLIDDNATLPGISGIGDVIQVFHSSPVLHAEPIAAVEALIFLENGTAADITEEDIAFIVSQGYTVKAG